MTLSCKVPFFNSNFRVVTSRTAGCGLGFPATSVSGTILQAPCSLMYGGQVSTGPTWFQFNRTSNYCCMAIAAESSTSPGLQSAALAIAAESLASPCLQLAAYPPAVAVTAALERSATIANVVASAAVAGNAVEGAGIMSKQVAVLSVHPSYHILHCWMDDQMLVMFHAMFIQTCSDWLNEIQPGEFI